MTYSYRKGNRSNEQFAKEIKERTSLERRAAESLVQNFFPQCSLEDHGCDNSGKVLYKGATQDADFILRKEDGEAILLEMKVSKAPCVTLKEDLISTFTGYKDRKDVWVDWCVNFGSPKETHYVMSPAASMDLFCKHGSYAAHKGFDGKPGWRLFQDRIEAQREKYPMERFSV